MLGVSTQNRLRFVHKQICTLFWPYFIQIRLSEFNLTVWKSTFDREFGWNMVGKVYKSDYLKFELKFFIMNNSGYLGYSVRIFIWFSDLRIRAVFCTQKPIWAIKRSVFGRFIRHSVENQSNIWIEYFWFRLLAQKSIDFEVVVIFLESNFKKFWFCYKFSWLFWLFLTWRCFFHQKIAWNCTYRIFE